MTHSVQRPAAIFLRQPLLFALFAAVIAGIFSAKILSHGVDMSPDGWVYWQGAVSILSGNGYSCFGGHPITVFPPFFSLYLAVIQQVVGVDGFGLTAAVVLLAIATTFVWTYLYILISNHKREALWIKILLTIFIATFIPYTYGCLLSETLSLMLLGLLLVIYTSYIINHSIMTSNTSITINKTVVMLIMSIATLSALLLTRNAMIAFLPGIAIISYRSFQTEHKSKPLLFTILSVSIPCLIWISFLFILGQHHAHPISYAGGRFSPVAYIGQLIAGIADSVLSAKFGLLKWPLVLVTLYEFTAYTIKSNMSTNPVEKVIMIPAIVGSTGIIGLYVLFNITWIADTFNGRFIWFVPLIIMGTLAAKLSWSQHNKQVWHITAILGIITVTSVFHTCSIAFYYPTNDLSTRVAFNQYIKPDYPEGPALAMGAKILIAPPQFPWHRFTDPAWTAHR